MTDSALHHITGNRRRCTTCGQPQNAPVHSVPAPSSPFACRYCGDDTTECRNAALLDAPCGA